MRKILLVVAAAFISTIGFSQECIEIFISEYVEGWSNNKAIELYNPTDEDIDLSDYRLERYSNGSTSAPAAKRLDLSGTIPALSVFVIVIDKRDSLGEGQEAPVWDELQDKADAFECPVYNDNNVMYFNGNDAMVLKNISGIEYIIDRIGKVGQDPFNGDGDGGWNDVGPDYTFVANGEIGWTKDHSLIRKSDVLIGDILASSTFNVGLQWDSIPPTLYDEDGFITGGNWASLGVHSCECGDAVGINEISDFSFEIYPNPAINNFTIESESAIVDVVVYNMAGHKVYSSTEKTQKLLIETEDWTKGFYLVNLRLDNGYVLSRKVMVQ